MPLASVPGHAPLDARLCCDAAALAGSLEGEDGGAVDERDDDGTDEPGSAGGAGHGGGAADGEPGADDGGRGDGGATGHRLTVQVYEGGDPADDVAVMAHAPDGSFIAALHTDFR